MDNKHNTTKKPKQEKHTDKQHNTHNTHKHKQTEGKRK